MSRPTSASGVAEVSAPLRRGVSPGAEVASGDGQLRLAQNEDASSATLARAALCACRSCPSPDATSAPGETPRLSGAETSATPDADVGRDIHQSPCHPTHSVPQTGWWCRCACSRASSYRTGLSSTAAPAASDLTLVFGSFHPNTAPRPCRAGSYTTPLHRSASLGISHPATA